MKVAYLVDFDGTITTSDLTSKLGAYFGGKKYQEIDEQYRKRNIPIRIWLQRMAEILPADLDYLEEWILEWAVIRPGYQEFIESASNQGSPVVIASDGFGFYIEPVLKKHGLLHPAVKIFRNDTVVNNEGNLIVNNPHAHRVCPVCGNCKAAHVLELKEAGHAVIYIGDGSNDRFGASWGDLIFARDSLAESCRENNFKYSQWVDFYDIIDVDKPNLSDRSQLALCCPKGDGIKKTVLR